MIVMRISHGPKGSHEKLSDLACPQVVRDHLDDVISPIDGRPQTSKRAYYRQVREAGCEINERATVRKTNRPDYDTSGLRGAIVTAMRHPQTDINGDEHAA